MTLLQKQNPEVDIVVPVYNAGNFAMRCLESILNTTCKTPYRLIIVNDGSNEKTTNLLREFSKKKTDIELLEHENNSGYTRAVNTGLKFSTAPFVILLNSDTEVTNYWLDDLLFCFTNNDQLGIAGPLSNAASWQSVPKLFDQSGQFCINNLPNGLSLSEMAKLVKETSICHYPEVSFINGFCFMIHRAVIDAIGYMDEEAFPFGYGEENDYCLRATQAGFKLAIVDNVYIYHAKSKSFGHDKRIKLSKAGSDNLKNKYGKQYFEQEAEKMRNIPPLDAFRHKLDKQLAALEIKKNIDWKTMKVLFVLPKPGIGGGSHSVVQEVSAMRQMGVDAGIAVEQRHLNMLYDRYQEIQNVSDLFVGYIDENLLEKAARFDIVVATIFHSTNLVKYITDTFPHILSAYYVQDYEPLFFDESDEFYNDAFFSYSRLCNGLLFAKTDWIAREVERHHGVPVNKVIPSIDHDVYFPKQNDNNDQTDQEKHITHIAAMIRPRTPRRGAERTMELMAYIQRRFKNRVKIRLFGCESDEPGFKSLKNDFEFIHYGILLRSGVAALLRESDIFVDLSDYQAFGRTSLEAMACGATAMVPIHGGGDEYAVDGKNSLVVDSFDLVACEERLVEVIEDPSLLKKLKTAAWITSQNYSPEKAAKSELKLMQKALSLHRINFPIPDKVNTNVIKKAELPKAITTTSMRRKRLWRKFRTRPRQYFEDSNVIGFHYIKYFFQEKTKAQMEHERNKALRKLDEVNRQKTKLNIELNDTNKKLRAEKKQKAKLTAELDHAKKQENKLAEEIVSAYQQLKQMQKHEVELTQDLEDTQAQLKKTKIQITELTLIHDNAIKQVYDQEKQLNSQSLQQELLEKKIIEADAQINLFKSLILNELRPKKEKN